MPQLISTITRFGWLLLTILAGSVYSQVIPTNQWINLYSDNSVLDKNPVPSGTRIKVYDPQGILCGYDTVSAPGMFGFLKVYRDDDTSVETDEGASPGDTLTFEIDDFYTIVAGVPVIWTENGAIRLINLEAKSNWPPQFKEIPAQMIWEGENFNQLNLQDYVSDLDNDPGELIYTILPTQNLQGVVNDGFLSVTVPDLNWYGNETIAVTVSDPAGLSDTVFITYIVSAVNDAPVVADIADQTIVEGSAFTAFILDAYVHDIDNYDTEISWDASGNTKLAVIIVDNVVTITVPSPDWNGSEAITFTATDPGGLSDSSTTLFTVSAVNDAPLVTDIPDQIIAEGSAFKAIILDAYVHDIDNDDTEISWDASGNTKLAVIIVDNVVTITVPNPDWNGSEAITFTATDPGGLSDSSTTLFTVSAVNDAPLVADIPDQTIAKGATFSDINLNNYVSDVDNVLNEISWAFSGSVDLDVTINPDNIASISAADVIWTGSEEIIFSATDPGGLSGSDAVIFKVSDNNDPPVLTAIPDQTVAEGGTFAKIILDDYVEDVDNSDAQICWSFTKTYDLSINIDENHMATIAIPDENWYGSETVIFTATDPSNLSDKDTVVFTVTPVNDAPHIIGIPDQTIVEGSAFVAINLDLYVEDIDNNSAEMNWSFSGNKELQVGIDMNHFARISVPSLHWNGSETIVFSVNDPGALMATDTVIFTVAAVNTGPVIGHLAPVCFREDDTLILTRAFFYDVVSDADNADSSLVFIMSNGSHVTTQLSDDRFIFSAPQNWFGSDTLRLTVSDGALTDSAKVLVLVQPVNDAPQIIDLPHSFTMDDTSTFVMDASDFVYDIDSPFSALHWNFSTDNDSLLLAYVKAVLTIKALAFSGDARVIIIVTDDSSASACDTFMVQINLVSELAVRACNTPANFSIGQNYPNPFNHSTCISYQLVMSSFVDISIYNLLGQEIAILVSENQAAGSYRIEWDATDYPSGIYLFIIEAGEYREVKKMVYLK